jgi:hypothetical protein
MRVNSTKSIEDKKEIKPIIRFCEKMAGLQATLLLCYAQRIPISQTPLNSNFLCHILSYYQKKRDLDLVASGDLPAIDDLVDVVVSLLVVELLQVEHASYVVL